MKTKGVYILLQNLQSTRVELRRGAELGVIEPLVATPPNDHVTRVSTESLQVETSCARIAADGKFDETRNQELLEAWLHQSSQAHHRHLQQPTGKATALPCSDDLS